jgi:hypothetical protein
MKIIVVREKQKEEREKEDEDRLMSTCNEMHQV